MLQRVYSLTPVASVIWDHLDGQHNLRGIAEKVTQQFDTDLEHATKDCVEFVEALLEAELVAKA